jgi:DNA-binding PadR family transcriptional regulator
MRHGTRCGHGHGRHGGYGPPGWVEVSGRGGRGRGHRGGYGYQRGPRGRRARRGDVRAAILTLLGEEPRNGYAVMQEIEQRSDGVWRPSPGSIYPALQQLEDEGLVRQVAEGDKRSYELTDAGREAVEERSGERAPWESAGEDVGDEVFELAHVTRQVGMAVRQLGEVGTTAQAKAATEILTDARRALYGLLAEDPQEDDAGDEPASD